MIERTVIFFLASSSEATHMTFFFLLWNVEGRKKHHSHAHNKKLLTNLTFTNF